MTTLKKHLFFLSLSAFFFNEIATAENNGNNNTNLPKDIAVQAQSRIDQGYHLGTVIGIIDKNGPRYYGFGQKSLSDNSVPDRDTLFEIGSLTKVFTATLIASLEINGKLDTRAPIGDYLSDEETPIKMDSDLLSLLTHTSGFPREAANMDAADDDRFKNYTKLDLLNYLQSVTTPSKTTEEYQYSNIGFIVLEHILEERFNTTYEELLNDEIIEALNLTNTHFKIPENRKSNIAKGFWDEKETPDLDTGIWQAMDGLRSTAKDMLHFLGYQMDLYQSPLNDAIKATHSQKFANDEITMGIGWQILERPESGKKMYFHRGGTNGFVSFTGFDPENKIGVIILVNGRRWFSDLGFRILDATYPLADVSLEN